MLLAALLGAALPATPSFGDTPKAITIPAGDLNVALETLVRQTGIQLLYDLKVVQGLKTHGVRSAKTPRDAISRLLEGTTLSTKTDSSGAILISAPSPTSLSTSGEQGRGGESVRLARADQGQDQGPSTVEQSGEHEKYAKSKQEESPSWSNKVKLEEVVVTGSRLPRRAADGAQQIKSYSQEQITQSGQTSVADFLNTQPEVGQFSTENPLQLSGGATTVQLHGLPIGTTLVLINGRRVETAGANAFSGIFDLNNIPLAAVDRIEVVSEGSSAVYGSDAIGGVVNIILKSNLEGFTADVKYGGASGFRETNASLTYGRRWDNDSGFTVVASYQTRGELSGFDRAITANDDYTTFGGADGRVTDCSPGNVFTLDGSNLPGAPSAPPPAGGNYSYAAVAANATGNPARTGFKGTYGVLNECSNQAFSSILPETHRAGILATGHLTFTPSLEAFSELLYSHVTENTFRSPATFYGDPRFNYAVFTLPASSPYNPFGETVGVDVGLNSTGRPEVPQTTNFVRALVGLRGDLGSSWKWEVSGWDAEDRSSVAIEHIVDTTKAQAALDSTDPATALNPFIAGPIGSPQQLQALFSQDTFSYRSRTLALNAFARGTIVNMPAGPLAAVIGAEYGRDTLYQQSYFVPGPSTQLSDGRYRNSVFGELRAPLIGTRQGDSARDVLAVSFAGRYDRYSDFGHKATPQFGAEWRPLEALLVRGTMSRAFKAPSLYQLYYPQMLYRGGYADPLLGNQTELVTVTSGGNPAVQPETGTSRTLGFVYASKAAPGLRLSATYWTIVENNSIQLLSAETLIAFESLFPANVIRAPSCTGGPPCPITNLSDSFINYGRLNLAGLDYEANYSLSTGIGQFSPSIAATQTYRYKAALLPGAAATNRVSAANDDNNWAPRWKGVVGLGWTRGPWSANAAGRYTGRYLDYDSTSHELGNDWFVDGSVRYDVARALSSGQRWMHAASVTLGGINLFNSLPRFSNYYYGIAGYSPAQSDIRGRYLYIRIGLGL